MFRLLLKSRTEPLVQAEAVRERVDTLEAQVADAAAEFGRLRDEVRRVANDYVDYAVELFGGEFSGVIARVEDLLD